MTADRSRLVRRIEVPLGHPDPWEWGLAMPYRCLADPEGALVMPASPDEIPNEYANWDRRHLQQLAYYTTLQSFLTYSFGWTRHDKGLIWWYEHGLPTDDPRFNLINEIWVRDATLAGYLGWVVSRMHDSPEPALAPLRPWAERFDLTPAHVPDVVANSLRDALKSDLWGGGSDPMHLWGGQHAGAPSGPQVFGDTGIMSEARLVFADPIQRSATVIVETAKGWYARLAELGGGLPQLRNGPSWRIDVIVKSIGFVGTYRRSRDTGLWFAGKHRYHTVGN